MQKCLYYNHFDTRLSLVLMSTNMQVSTAKAISHYKDKQKFTETPNFGRKLFCCPSNAVSKISITL